MTSSSPSPSPSLTASPTASSSTPSSLPAIRAAIASILDCPAYDDGSLGPLFVRLSWHSSGTFDLKDQTGGSNGGRIRFAPESTDDANKGLQFALHALKDIHKKYQNDISHADLFTLCGVVAIEKMGGPEVKWRGGRKDFTEKETKKCPVANGRLPDAAQGAKHIRQVFHRMGFTDREIVALSGAHTIGRCHVDRSGFTGPWTNTPTRFSNQYFILLLSEKWRVKKWSGPLQYEDEETQQLMMLPTDLALIQDEEFKKYVTLYAKDKDTFFKDFAEAFSKLIHLGLNAHPVKSKL